MTITQNRCSVKIEHFHGKHVVIIGGSKGLERAIVGAVHTKGL